MSHQRNEPFDWTEFLDLGTISSVINGAHGEFKKLLDAAEYALSINPKTLENELMIIVLHVISRIGVYDHALVGRMLDAIYNAKGHFFFLFVDALMSGEDISEEDVKSGEYFLTIGSRKRYRLIDGNKVPFVDVPFMNSTLAGICLRRGRPSALRMFLRHGADPLAALGSLAFMRLDACQLTDRKIQALQLLASVSNLPYGRTLAALVPIPPEPSSLKHLCKVVVRRCLAEAGYLPMGIQTLHIPLELHSYLDLKGP